MSSTGVRQGAWSADLCGCWATCVPNCLMSWFCPCVTYGQISHRIGVKSFQSAIASFGGVVCLLLCTRLLNLPEMVAPADEIVIVDKEKGTYMIDYDKLKLRVDVARAQAFAPLILVLFLCCMVMNLRQQVRARYNIPGGCCSDCCCACWCQLCVLAQMATHVESYQRGSCFFSPLETLPPVNEMKPVATVQP